MGTSGRWPQKPSIPIIANLRSDAPIYVIGSPGYLFQNGADKMVAAAAAGDALDPVVARRQLAEVLTAARTAAGKPKLVTLARAIGYHESMLSRVLNGRLVPTRDKLERLAEQLDVDMSTFTSVWVPLWEAASRKPTQKPDAAAESPTAGPPGVPTGFECPACGSWVVNASRHIEWHLPPATDQSGGTVTQLRPVQ